MRPRRDRLDDVGAAAEAAVDNDGGAAGDGVDDFRQHLHRAAAVIELPAAVIGDVDELNAVIERNFRVLRGGDPFERQRNVEAPLDVLDRAPIERGLKLVARGAYSPAGHVALGDVALAAAVDGGIDGEAEHGVAAWPSRARHARRPRPDRRGHKVETCAAPPAPPALPLRGRARRPSSAYARRRIHAPPARRLRHRPDQTSPGCRPDRARPAAAACGRAIGPTHRSCPRRAARADAARSYRATGGFAASSSRFPSRRRCSPNCSG